MPWVGCEDPKRVTGHREELAKHTLVTNWLGAMQTTRTGSQIQQHVLKGPKWVGCFLHNILAAHKSWGKAALLFWNTHRETEEKVDGGEAHAHSENQS